MDIQLVPCSLLEPEVIAKLKVAITKAEALRGCVAFWLIKNDLFGNTFSELIGREKSFYCIDIHKPTDLQSIDEHFHNGASNLYLHLYKIGRSKELPSLPNHLLHAKIMLFDLPDNKAEIWIGSHNLTFRALMGINREASTVITCDRDCDFYRQVDAYLYTLKELCDLYDPHNLPFYQRLQNGQSDSNESGEIVNTISIVSNNSIPHAKQTILLLGDNESDLESLGLGKINNEIYVNVLNLYGQRNEWILKAEVQSSGRIDDLNPASYGLRFSNRSYAIRQHPYIPYQSEREKEFGFDELKSFKYWANIYIEGPLEGAWLESPKKLKDQLWYKVKDRRLENLIPQDLFGSNAQQRELEFSDRSLEEKPIIYRAISPETNLRRNNSLVAYRNQYSLTERLNRSDSNEVLSFFRNNFELRYFDYTKNPMLFNQGLPEKGTEMYRKLKEFRSDKLGKKMRLVTPINKPKA